jgi:ATP-binding cassette subfamily C protein
VEGVGDMHELFKSSMIVRSFLVFEKRIRNKLFLSVAIQSCLAILDLIGIAIIGLIGAMSVRGIQSEGNPSTVNSLLAFLNIQSYSFQIQIAILACLSIAILITKTIISIIAIRRIYHFMSIQSAQLSKRLLEQILNQPLSFITSLTPNNILYSVTAGCSRIALGITGNYISLVADGFLLLILFAALMFVDPVMTLIIGLFFSVAIISFHQFIKGKAERVGEIESQLNIESNQQVLEGLATYRERYTNNTLPALTYDFLATRIKLSNALAESAFLPNVTKYVIESLILIGALVVCGVQFAINDAGQAIATLSIFIGAATRVTPAIMRVQQSLIQIRNSSGAARSALQLIEQLRPQETSLTYGGSISSKDYDAQIISLRDVTYRYPDSNHIAVSNVNLDLFRGESIALIGPSGGGKSTIADLILGIAEPVSGAIRVCGQSPRKLITEKQGFIGYVPQLTTLISANLRKNLLMGLDPNDYGDEHLNSILESVGLSIEFQELEINLDSMLGEAGSNLSGGQLQRLGIARALVPRPELLILDEATSSLDASSEHTVTKTIASLRGEISTVIIAHRLSTIRDVTRIYYVKNGVVVASGSFEKLRNDLEEFRTQAELMGL